MAATAANKGQMPVLVPGWRDDIADFDDDLLHTRMVKTSHLKILGDWVTIPHNGRIEAMASPGDFLEDLGDDFAFPARLVWIVLVVLNRKELIAGRTD